MLSQCDVCALKNLFSEPLQEFDFSLTGSQILRNSQVLLNKYFSSTYNFGCKFSKSFSKTETFIQFFWKRILFMKLCVINWRFYLQ